MAHFLNASQLAEACVEFDMQEELRLMEAVCQVVGQAIARKFNVEIITDASTEPGFGGLCVGYGPKEEGQLCPDELRQFDTSSDWAEESVAIERQWEREAKS